MTLEEQLEEARAEGAERMRALCASIDPYELHLSGAPFARIISTPGSLIQIMQEGILALPNPYTHKDEEMNDD